MKAREGLTGEAVYHTLVRNPIGHAQTVVAQRFTVQCTEVGIAGSVSIVRHFADVDLVGDGRVSAVKETVVRTLVRFIVNGGGFSR